MADLSAFADAGALWWVTFRVKSLIPSDLAPKVFGHYSVTDR